MTIKIKGGFSDVDSGLCYFCETDQHGLCFWHTVSPQADVLALEGIPPCMCACRLCITCDGAGKVWVWKWLVFRNVLDEVICKTCDGKGVTFDD